MKPDRIGDLLVSAGIITRDALEACLTGEARPAGRVLSHVLALGLAHERALAELLARRTGVPVVVLSESTLDLRALQELPADFVREFGALPVAADASTLTVVLAEPDAPNLLTHLGLLSGKRVIAMVGLHGVVSAVIERAYTDDKAGLPTFRGAQSPHANPELALAQPPAAAQERVLALTDLLVAAGLDDSLRVRARALAKLKVPQAWPALIVGAQPRVEIPAVPAPALGERVALVVDDDEGIRNLVAITLSHDKYQVVAAANGDEALAKLRTMRPDIIILDGMMPGLHGFEVLIALKQSAAHKDIPVVMCSAVYTDWLQARSIEETHGADAFLKKPFGLAQLRAVVAQLTNRDVPQWQPPESAEKKLVEVEGRMDDAVQRGDVETAERLASECLAIDPFSPRGWLARGDVCLSRGDAQAAWSAFENAIVYGPGNTTSLVTLALVAERLGFRRRAQAIWRRARDCANEEQRGIIEAYPTPQEQFVSGGG